MAWYDFPIISTYGVQDRQGAYWQPDLNIACPPGTTVTALLPGIVTSSRYTDFGQWTITYKLDTPVNELATHFFAEHLHDSLVTIGQKIDVGTPLGNTNHEGEGAVLGIGYYSGDVYGSGQSWTILQNDLKPGGKRLLDPTPLIESARNGTIAIPDSPVSSADDLLTKTGVYIAENIFKIPDVVVQLNKTPYKLLGGLFYASLTIAASFAFFVLVGM